MSSPVWGGGTSQLTRTWYNPPWGKASDDTNLTWDSTANGEFQATFDASKGFTPVAAETSLIETATIGERHANDFGGGGNQYGGFLDFDNSGGSKVRLVIYGGGNYIGDGDEDWRVYWPFCVVTGYENVIFNLMAVEADGSNRGANRSHVIQGGPVKNVSRTQVSVPCTGRLNARHGGGGRDTTIEGLNPWLSDASTVQMWFNSNRNNNGYFQYVPLFLGEV